MFQSAELSYESFGRGRLVIRNRGGFWWLVEGGGEVGAGKGTKVVLDGTAIDSVSAFIRGLATALAERKDHTPYFGWDLHSLQDCLCGGYLGEAPYDIHVEEGGAMAAVFDHLAWANYCEEMLQVIEGGGRGLIQEHDRTWFVTARAKAERGKGPTLLEVLFDLIRSVPARIQLFASDGTVFASAEGDSFSRKRSDA